MPSPQPLAKSGVCARSNFGAEESLGSEDAESETPLVVSPVPEPEFEFEFELEFEPALGSLALDSVAEGVSVSPALLAVSVAVPESTRPESPHAANVAPTMSAKGSE
jgi:hypothetical protein